MHTFKRYLYLLIVIFLIFFIIFSAIIFTSKSFLTDHLINSGVYIKSHYSSLSDRITKFYILKKDQKSKNFILGLSASQTINPELVKKYNNKKTLNLSLGGAKIIENYKYINWILNNKKNTDTIIISISPASFNEISYSREPFEIQNKFYDKFENYYSWLNLKDAIKIFINKAKLHKNNEKVDKYFYSGLRFYQDYFDELNNDELKRKNILMRKNNIPKIPQYIIEKKSINYLIKINEECKKNNINLKIFFQPVTELYFSQNDFEYLYQELKLIKKLINKNLEIYYFNNLNELNKDLSLWIGGHNHLNYDGSNKIVEDLLFNENTLYGIKLEKNNFKNFLIKLIKKTNSNKLNAIY